MDTDWQDKGPDAYHVRREIYNACTGRIFTFDGEAYLVQDTSNFMLLGSQGEDADYCKATDSVALTEVDASFQDKRDLLTEHLRLVSGAGKCGANQFRWLKAVAFVHYCHDATPPLQGMVKARGSPFKNTILKIEYDPEGIMYTVQHHTDRFVHKAHISDFRAMGDGSYPA